MDLKFSIFATLAIWPNLLAGKCFTAFSKKYFLKKMLLDFCS